MVFVLDNYDSFTYNLVQYMGELGAEMIVRRNDEITLDEVEALNPERILISPGPCTPQEAGISMDLIRHFAGKLPILGRLPRPSGHRRRLRRQGHPRPEPDARQDQRGRARRPHHLRRNPHPRYRHPLPLAHRRKRKTCPQELEISA